MQCSAVAACQINSPSYEKSAMNSWYCIPGINPAMPGLIQLDPEILGFEIAPRLESVESLHVVQHKARWLYLLTKLKWAD